MQCTTCKSEMRQIPAGISKKTGKPYTAFWSCPNRCPKTPAPVYTPTPEPKVNWDEISWGKCKHAYLLAAFQNGDRLEEAEPEAEAWADASMRKLGNPKLREMYGETYIDQQAF